MPPKVVRISRRSISENGSVTKARIHTPRRSDQRVIRRHETLLVGSTLDVNIRESNGILNYAQNSISIQDSVYGFSTERNRREFIARRRREKTTSDTEELQSSWTNLIERIVDSTPIATAVFTGIASVLDMRSDGDYARTDLFLPELRSSRGE